MQIYQNMFNLGAGTYIAVSVNKEGVVSIDVPGTSEAILVIEGHPIEIRVDQAAQQPPDIAAILSVRRI